MARPGHALSAVHLSLGRRAGAVSARAMAQPEPHRGQGRANQEDHSDEVQRPTAARRGECAAARQEARRRGAGGVQCAGGVSGGQPLHPHVLLVAFVDFPAGTVGQHHHARRADAPRRPRRRRRPGACRIEVLVADGEAADVGRRRDGQHQASQFGVVGGQERVEVRRPGKPEGVGRAGSRWRWSCGRTARPAWRAPRPSPTATYTPGRSGAGRRTAPRAPPHRGRRGAPPTRGDPAPGRPSPSRWPGSWATHLCPRYRPTRTVPSEAAGPAPYSWGREAAGPTREQRATPAHGFVNRPRKDRPSHGRRPHATILPVRIGPHCERRP